MIRFVPAHLLGRHVADRSHHRARIGNLFPGVDLRTDTLVTLWPQLRQTEIENLHAAIGGDEEIFRLEIAMSDSPFMCHGETLSNLLGVVERLALLERAVVQLLTQLFAFEQF